MKIFALLLATTLLASAAPINTPAPAGGDITVPKVLTIGGTATAGSIRVIGVSCTGIASGPYVDVHTKAAGVEIRDLSVVPEGPKKDQFAVSFTLVYTKEAPGRFDVIVRATGGTTSAADGLASGLILVQRS